MAPFCSTVESIELFRGLLSIYSSSATSAAARRREQSRLRFLLFFIVYTFSFSFSPNRPLGLMRRMMISSAKVKALLKMEIF